MKICCQASNLDITSNLSWSLNDKKLNFTTEEEIVTEVHTSTDGMILVGSLVIRHLQPSHGGMWGCCLYSSEGNKTKTVEIRVLSENTEFCSESITTSNKGSYKWPRTVESVTVQLPCWTSSANSQSRHLPTVTRVCNDRGVWEQLDTSRCPYVSEVTKVLEQFTKVRL